jgi:hypothetical protein
MRLSENNRAVEKAKEKRKLRKEGGWGGRLRSRVMGERARESGVDVSWFL